MTILVSIDDTDNLNSRGTGRLARAIANTLAGDYPVYGVTRHQLYMHPDIPYTSHNSCAVIHVESNGNADIDTIFTTAQDIMLADFIEGSDPGIAVASADQVSPPLIAFGKDAKCTILTQEKARTLAKNLNIRLRGLGGTEDGVIRSNGRPWSCREPERWQVPAAGEDPGSARPQFRAAAPCSGN